MGSFPLESIFSADLLAKVTTELRENITPSVIICNAISWMDMAARKGENQEISGPRSQKGDFFFTTYALNGQRVFFFAPLIGFIILYLCFTVCCLDFEAVPKPSTDVFHSHGRWKADESHSQLVLEQQERVLEPTQKLTIKVYHIYDI